MYILTIGMTVLRKILSPFCLLTNGKVLLRVASSPGSYTCLNGIKVIAMSSVVLSHSLQVDQTAVLAIGRCDYCLLTSYPLNHIRPEKERHFRFLRRKNNQCGNIVSNPS